MIVDPLSIILSLNDAEYFSLLCFVISQFHLERIGHLSVGTADRSFMEQGVLLQEEDGGPEETPEKSAHLVHTHW